ncbi:DNA-binding response OmpR family regulator [Bacillus pakistanensis]|uniref:DNA-binding response OmpR family regulator n=1 Tax=Rossellomorea pakistanensis TaxID=992288 RepID=A0ABS2NE47_9BACI|nr:response regulator transcription factor [Bacillus pakistanensis]MBM7586130.1 DNA-binding response OmpR family regulator [Bacillus pakistanensis]
MFKILIVEDDVKLVSLLEDFLYKYGYEPCTVKSFDTVLAEFEQFEPHIVLLDVNLPKYDGYYWCRQIRKISTCPILFVSARDAKMDQVMALENGADDYITKPFDYEIVLAKIKSQLRRAYGSYAVNQNGWTVKVNDLVLDVERLELRLGEKKVELSHTEARILEELMNKADRVVGRERLLGKIWDDQVFVDDNTLNVYITRVRKKLAQHDIHDALQTVRGRGYLLTTSWSTDE